MALTENVLSWRGRNAVDRDGDKLGTIEEIYLDRETNQPEWALVKTGMFGTRSTFVPISSASETGNDISIPFEKALVKDAPNIDADGELSPAEEQRLYEHYNLSYGTSSSGSGFDTDRDADMTDRDADMTTGTGTVDRDFDSNRETVGRDVSGPTTDDAMTRSEEELQINKERRQAGEARLRKYVVTENVSTTVPVQREEVRVEREPITDANIDNAMDGPAISEEEHAVTLMEEEVNVEKRAVPKERVRMETDTVTENRQVDETVQKERIEVDGDTTSGRLSDDETRRDL